MTAGAAADGLELLVLADTHYVHHTARECPIPARKGAWGRELVRRALRDTRREGHVDAIVLMGDLVDTGTTPGAEEDLIELRDEIASLGVPILVAPGNHDGSAERLGRLFGDRLGVHRLGGYQLVTFCDPYRPTQEAARPADDLSLVLRARADHPDEPIVAIQHSNVHPHIESTYPYNLTNAPEVMRSYEEAGVVLSVSGHYHPGIAPQSVSGVAYVTAPALCEAPFRFLRVSLKGRTFTVTERRLALDEDVPLCDYHVHTEYAYCRDDVTAQTAIERAAAFGVDRICLTEHAGQLYLSPEDYWSHRFGREGDLIAHERAAGRDRVGQFRAEMRALRSERVGVGLEVELDADRKLTLLEEDTEGWDVIIGAVHKLVGVDEASAPTREIVRGFMRETEALVSLGVRILAHPFRYFRRAKLPVPVGLYHPMAELLAAHGVAAEVNYHTNDPDPRFFETCAESGVRIALGSDSHGLWEVGDLRPHLKLVEQVVAGGTGNGSRTNALLQDVLLSW
jgi:histidinol phosphatase-like PHP family hydrolase/predicted MPP superfamily phosphohydrolase